MYLSILLPMSVPFPKFPTMGMEWCFIEIKLNIYILMFYLTVTSNRMPAPL